ncbi:MAG: hypothetical protein JXQ23_11460 [Clostridia bacterium]|nr:hypothetical protein [Clostridia bacterium]
MKKNIFIITIIILIVTSGCSSDNEINVLKEENREYIQQITDCEAKIMSLEERLNKEVISSELELRIKNQRDNRLFFTLEEREKVGQTVYIVGNMIDQIIEEYSYADMKGTGQEEFYKVEIAGTVYDFSLFKVTYDESTEEFSEGELIQSLGTISNMIVMIETTIPEGLPMEKIKWKDENGNESEILISYDGYGFNGMIFWNH